MSQYKTGTVSVTNGSPTVTGTDTLWAGLSTPLYFKIDQDGEPVYEVASVDSNTQITLAGNYQGTTQSGLQYQLVQDFSNNLGIPLPSQGDVDSGDWLRRAIVEIDQWLFGPKWGVNTETLNTTKTLTVNSKRVQFLDPGGTNRDVVLPPEENSQSLMFFVFNTSTTYDLYVKNDGLSTIITVQEGKSGYVMCNGSIWRGLLGS